MRPVRPDPPLSGRKVSLVNQFRKFARFIVLFVLFGMLIVSFALWGIGDMLKLNPRNTAVAHVGGTHIPLYGWLGGVAVPVEEVRDIFNRQLEQIQRQTGQRPEPEQAIRYGLHIRALEDALQRAVLDNAVRQYGLSISDAEVRAAIAQKPIFQGAGGSFDPLRYRQFLQNARLTEAQVVADVRREIASIQLLGVVRTEGLAPKSLRDDVFRMESEKRVAETVYIPDAIVTTVPKPTAEQLGTYFDANKAKFQIPEYRAFTYVLLSIEDVINKVTVTPEQVKQDFEARAAEFGAPEKRDVDQAMVDSEDKAKKIIATVAAGKSLEEAATEVLGNADGVIKLGSIQKKDLPPGALADGVFTAPQGLAPAPIQSTLGWHIVRINKIEPGKTVPFEEVKEKLEKDLKAQAAPELLIKLVTDFERVLTKTQSLATAAQDLQIPLKTIENVDARGQDPTGKQVVVGPGAAELVQAAFATRESRESELLETRNSEFLVVRTDRVTPARTPVLSEVEAKVVEAWDGQERRRLADEKVKGAVDKANAGEDLAAIAKELGLELRTAKPVTRFEADTANYLTQAATVDLFKLAVGKAQAVRSAEGSVIVRPKEIQAPDLVKEKETLDKYGKQLDVMVANDLVAQLLAALRLKFGVTVNDAAFAAAFQPQQQPQTP